MPDDDLDPQDPTDTPPADPTEPEVPEGDPPLDPPEVAPPAEEKPAETPEEKPAEEKKEPEPDPAEQEIEQLAGDFAKESSQFVPQLPPDTFDYGAATPEEAKAHSDERTMQGVLMVQVHNAREKYDGSNGQPTYEQAIKDSGLEARFDAERQAGTGPLTAFLSKKPNPFEAIYKLGLSTLKKQGKMDDYKQTEPAKTDTNGSEDMAKADSADAVKTAAAAEPRGKGLAGVRGSSAADPVKYTMESVAEIAKDPSKFKRLPADVRQKALEGTLPMANA